MNNLIKKWKYLSREDKQNYKQWIINFTLALLLVSMIAGAEVTFPKQEIEVLAKEETEALESTTEVQNTIVEEVETPETYIKKVFGNEQGERAIKMLKECENKSLRIDATNWNKNGTWDKGLFQINQIHGYTEEQLFDYKFNIEVAYKIYKNAGYSFSPWTCAYHIGEVPFYLK